VLHAEIDAFRYTVADMFGAEMPITGRDGLSVAEQYWKVALEFRSPATLVEAPRPSPAAPAEYRCRAFDLYCLAGHVISS
jgi:hypothetical protein